MKATLVLCGVFLWVMGLSAETSDTDEEKQVMATLEALFQAYPKRDAATLNRLYHDDLSYGHSAGNLQTKSEVIEDVNKRTWESLRITSRTVRVSGAVAIVRAIMDIRNGPSRDRVRTATGISVLYVLVRSPQGWQVIARQSTRTAESNIPNFPSSGLETDNLDNKSAWRGRGRTGLAHVTAKRWRDHMFVWVTRVADGVFVANTEKAWPETVALLHQLEAEQTTTR